MRPRMVFSGRSIDARRGRRGSSTACAGVLALVLTGLLVLAAAATGAAQGLKLREAEEKVLETFDRPNPHFSLACSDCHEGRPELGKDTAATVKFVNGTAGNVDLCYRCHDTTDNI